MNLIDPLKIRDEDLPLIVLSGHDTNAVSWLIRLFTQSSYNHVMIMTKKDCFASQGLFFREVPVRNYLKRGNRLKFWKMVNLTYVQKTLLLRTIEERLALPLWKRRYDFLGVLGQVINIKWLNNPFTTFCSEQVAIDLSKIRSYIKGKPSPEDLNKLFKERDGEYKYYGHWLSD